MIRLDIGSGTAPLPDYLTIDPYMDNADYKNEMWSLPFALDEVDEIYSSHALEHIPTRMVIPTLAEWKRVIKPEGKITLRVPDLEWCCQHFLTHQNAGWDMMVLFGNQNHDGEFHKTGFTERILKMYAFTVGFRITRFEKIWTHEQQTLSIELTK